MFLRALPWSSSPSPIVSCRRTRLAATQSLDLSTIELPPLCQFVGLKTDSGGRVVDFERLELIGVETLQVVRGPIGVSIRALADYVPRHTP
jgi:hypothetical protein